MTSHSLKTFQLNNINYSLLCKNKIEFSKLFCLYVDIEKDVRTLLLVTYTSSYQ